MAITAETRTGIITLSVAMLGSAPGTAQLSEWVEAVDEGMTLEDLANHIASSSAFKALYPVFQTNEDFAMYFLGNVFGGEVAADALEAAADIVVGVLESGTSRGEVALMVVGALHDIAGDPSHAAQGAFGMAAANLANKTMVAEYYTIDHKNADASSDVLDGVTSDMATVGKAKHDLDSPAADAMFGEVGDLSIDENMASGSVGMVMAADPNHTGMYPDPVAYSLKDAPEGFSIDENSGEISYMGAGLDHEATPTIELTVVATSTGADGTPTGVEQMVTVMVGDVSEEGPAFGDVGEFKLYEHASGAGEGNAVSVGKITAEDADGDPVTYTIKDNPEGWAILADGKLCYVGEGIDYETTTSVDLTIVATSTGDGSKDESVEQHITVDIVDRHDVMFGDPELMPLNEQMSGADTPIALGRVKAMDADEEDKITYSLKGNAVDAENPGLLHIGFSIDASTGVISYTGQGIHNSISSAVKLTVVATSTGDNGMATPREQEVTIDIQAREDAKFGDVGDLMIMENADGSGNPLSVGYVMASDANGDGITYSIKGESGGWAILDGGKLCYVGEGLDYETTPMVDLTIIATSVGKNGEATPVEQDVTVMVGNLNDNAPTGVSDLEGEGKLHATIVEEDTDTGYTFSIEDADGAEIGDYSAAVYEGEGDDMAVSKNFMAMADADNPTMFKLVAIGGAELAAGDYDLTIKVNDGGMDDEGNAREAVMDMVSLNIPAAPPAPEPPQVVGQTISLTKGPDNLKGTGDNDTFVALTGTLSNLDNLDGGDGSDTLEIRQDNKATFTVPNTVRTAGIESIVINTVGAFNGDLSHWDGLESVHLAIVGNDKEDENDSDYLTVNLNANGATVMNSEALDGTICIDSGSMVDLSKVSKASAVKIASGSHTTTVSVAGGNTVDIGKKFNNGEVADDQSATVTNASIDGSVGAVTIRSNAISMLSLANMTNPDSGAAVTVTNDEAKSKDDLTVTVNKFGNSMDNPATTNANERQEASLVQSGGGTGANVSLVVEGASFMTLRNDVVKMLDISGTATVELSVDRQEGVASTTLESIKVTGAAGLTMDDDGAQTVSGMTALKSIDGSGTSGAIKLMVGDGNEALKSISTGGGKDSLTVEQNSVLETIATGSNDDVVTVTENSALKSIKTGAGNDTVTVNGPHRDGGLTVDLEGGDDTYKVTGDGVAKSSIKGGSGTDTLGLTMYDHAYIEVNDESIFHYSGFEVLDVGGTNTDDYNMARLREKVGISDVQVSGMDATGVTLNEVLSGTDVSVIGVNADITYNKATTNSSTSVNLSLRAIGSVNDKRDAQGDFVPSGDEALAILTFTAAGVKSFMIDSVATVKAKPENKVVASDYSNTVTLNAAALETLVVRGDAELEVTLGVGSASKLKVVDARNNDAGVTVDASAAENIGGDNNPIRRMDFRGGDGNDNFTGGDDTRIANILQGHDGDDMLTGGAGEDRIEGGDGMDTLDGGGGADTFRFLRASDSQLSFNKNGSISQSRMDTIENFVSGEDEIDISRIFSSRELAADIPGSSDGILNKNGPTGSTTWEKYIEDNSENFFVGQDVDANNNDVDVDFAVARVGNYIFIDVDNDGDFDLDGDLVIMVSADVAITDFI